MDKLKCPICLIDINDTNFSLKNYADVKIANSLLYTNENNLQRHC